MCTMKYDHIHPNLSLQLLLDLPTHIHLCILFLFFCLWIAGEDNLVLPFTGIGMRSSTGA